MLKIFTFLFSLCLALSACQKDHYPLGEVDETIDFFSKRQAKPRAQWNTLDSLCDSIHRAYGVEVIYEYSPRIVSGSTFFMPPQYDQALRYTQVMLDKIWLKPLKESFPEFFARETPIEFIIAGGYIHFNSPSAASVAAGAGLMRNIIA